MPFIVQFLQPVNQTMVALAYQSLTLISGWVSRNLNFSITLSSAAWALSLSLVIVSFSYWMLWVSLVALQSRTFTD
jgi:hypothetical protein